MADTETKKAEPSDKEKAEDLVEIVDEGSLFVNGQRTVVPEGNVGDIPPFLPVLESFEKVEHHSLAFTAADDIGRPGAVLGVQGGVQSSPDDEFPQGLKVFDDLGRFVGTS